jgi:hypothetical protein
MLATKNVTVDNLVPFVLTLSNTFGLCIVVFMLGYGLVEVPRLTWRRSDPHYSLRLLEFRAPELDAAVYDSKCALEEVVAEVGHCCKLDPLPGTPYRILACVPLARVDPWLGSVTQVKAFSRHLTQNPVEDTHRLRACLDIVTAKVPVELLDAPSPRLLSPGSNSQPEVGGRTRSRICCPQHDAALHHFGARGGGGQGKHHIGWLLF